MDITVSHTFLQVHDQQVALEFYRDVLGLEVRADAPIEQYRWLSLGSEDQPGLEIVLEDPSMGRPDDDARALRALLAKGSLSSLIFRVDDCDATFEKLRAAGAEVMQEPVDQAYGVRDCAFRDPSGNQLRFSGPIRAGAVGATAAER
ncbi:VOC family protein [Saccharothrix longispora]|uniref:Catechol 2,3-dioxygenase-like lactoylglutathione lyase family enzyme n=1 Tax=Saccharothrix longispora TaxID=33920 RepID=A0ABU1PYL3_9PSEU|nr:VOC family protein [Saccharothrix longispora]MDR6595733.1 catechol 2,3-dioxygenase-like lactoylglutathione lyase family enzyme [Saccharothrix longispora]